MKPKNILIKVLLLLTFVTYSQTKKLKEVVKNNNKSVVFYKDGEIITYYKNKNISSRKHYKNGMLNGLSIYYYKSGKIKSKGNWKNNEQYGFWTYYYDDNSQKKLVRDYKSTGFLVREFYLKNGTQTLKNGKGKIKEYYNNGQLSLTSNYEKGSRSGITTWYYDNGQVKQSALYKKSSNINLNPYGLRWEVLSSFNKNGNPREKGTLKGGEGTWIVYDNDNHFKVKEYKKGKEIQ